MAYNGLSQHVNFEELPAPGDRFVLQDLIGEGTYGEVYSARDTVTGNTSSYIYIYIYIYPVALSFLTFGQK
jgi:serine/threonine protein kinase